MSNALMRAAIALVVMLGGVAHAGDPCIRHFRAAERLRLDGNAVVFCDDEDADKQQCFAVDLATGKAAAAHPRAEPVPSDTTLTIATRSAKACLAGGGACKTLVPKAHIDQGLAMHGVARGERAALINMAEVETFDVKTGKRLARFTAGKGDCTNVKILAPDLLLVKNADCGSDDGGTSFFATAKGKKTAAVPIAASDAHVLDTTVAFVAATGDRAVVMDGPTGKVVTQVTLGEPASDVFPTVVADGKRLVVVYGGDRAGDLAGVELASGKVATFAARRCP
jgi:hypothetical protein